MDKYYMLVRKFVNASFRLLVRTEWDAAAVKEYNSILSGPNGPLWWSALLKYCDVDLGLSLQFQRHSGSS